MISELTDVYVLDSTIDQAQNSYYCLTVILEGMLGNRRAEVIRGLNERGIGTSIYYPHPVPRLTYYREKYGYCAEKYPNAIAISDQSIALPVGPHLGLNDMDNIGRVFKKVIEGEREVGS